MSQQIVDQYMRWFIRHVRDEALKRIANQQRANNATEPHDSLHRGPYSRLLRAGVPEAALPAVMDLVIRSVDAALELALWQADQLRTTGHLRVSLLESGATGERPATWLEVSDQHLTWEGFCPSVEESAELREAKDLDLVIRGPELAGGEWESPVQGNVETSGSS